MAEKRTMYQRKVDVDMLNVVKSALADISSISPLSEERALVGTCMRNLVCTIFEELIKYKQ